MTPRVRMLIALSNADHAYMQDMVNRLNLPLREVWELNECLASFGLTRAS